MYDFWWYIYAVFELRIDSLLILYLPIDFSIWFEFQYWIRNFEIICAVFEIMSSISTPDTGRRRYSESSAPTTPSTNRRGSNTGIDVFFKRRASSVRVRKPSYSYLVVKPCTHDDGLSSGKVLKADRWCWYCLLVLYLSFFFVEYNCYISE